MSFFRMSTATANLTSQRTRVCGQNLPITCEPANRDFWKSDVWRTRAETDCLSVWQADWLTSVHASRLTTVVYQSVCMFVCLCERTWGGGRASVSESVCVRHGTRLRCKNDQNEPAPLFLSLPFVSATTLIHSDILLFITKWLLTKLLYALQRAHTNLFTTPSTRVEGSIHLQFK